MKAPKKQNIIWKVFSRIFLKEITVKNGDKEYKANPISTILIIASIVASLVILEKTGVIDDIISLVKKPAASATK